MRMALVQWVIIALLAATTIAAVIDAGRARTTQEAERVRRITDEALSIIPFSSSVVVQDVNPSTRQMVLTFFNSRLGIEAHFVATAPPKAVFASYQPTITNGIITGFSKRKELTMDQIPVGASGTGTLYVDRNGLLQIQSIVFGTGAWDR
ncbi:MAG: hypothetical protein KBE09_02180 [Candidatus Pacebacteria bacterium]|nr:hypothetical protein [Candidatus Paceibacterota bacterium]